MQFWLMAVLVACSDGGQTVGDDPLDDVLIVPWACAEFGTPTDELGGLWSSYAPEDIGWPEGSEYAELRGYCPSGSLSPDTCYPDLEYEVWECTDGQEAQLENCLIGSEGCDYDTPDGPYPSCRLWSYNNGDRCNDRVQIYFGVAW